MVPLESYWIHSLANDQFGLITNRGVTNPPSRNMYAGWNLIGADIYWELEEESVDTVLSSIEKATGDVTGYTQVLSVDQWNEWEEEFECCHSNCSYGKWFHEEPWVYVAGEPYYGQDMTRGGGYWVFMANQAVLLAGFNQTPLGPSLWMLWYNNCCMMP